MTDEAHKDSYLARKFIEGKLIQMAKEAADEGISADVFEALVIDLTDELDFNDIINNEKEVVQ